MAAASRAKTSNKLTPYALLIRGINVGTKNSLPMAELRKMLASLGAEGIQTYVQSGNAVFSTELSPNELTQRIEALISDYMGRPVGTTLRSAAEMAKVASGSPLSGVATSPTYHCVTFLAEKPTAAELKPLTQVDFGSEQFVVVGREIYSWHPEGQGRSALAAALSKLKLRGTATTRNFRTVDKLHQMLLEF